MLFKFLIIMKLSLMFILLSVLQTHEGVLAQGSITLSMRQVEIEKVLNKIEKEGEFRFLYNYDLNSLKKKVDVDFEESSISDVLNKVFANTDLTYKMLGNNLIVVISTTQLMANIRITGKVTGLNGEPLSGVSITVKGTAIGATTDNNGVYTMTVPDDATLVVSYIGDETKEVKVNGQSVVDIQLSPSNRQLDQVVVVGYGAQRQKDITSAISIVSTKDISSRPMVSAVEAITGKAAGVQVSVPSGMPGSDL